jgi:hypothetical protein
MSALALSRSAALTRPTVDGCDDLYELAAA